MVCTPAPGIAKAIVSAPTLALASSIAWRSDPAPESFTFVTVNVAAESGRAAAVRVHAAIRCRSKRTS